MSKYIIDTENGTCVPYENVSRGTLVEKFQPHRGVTEYNGVVADIQKWYYGSLVRAPWCATALSYFANELGILDQFGGKAENVYTMMTNCSQSNYGNFYWKKNIPEQIKKGDVLFMLWDSGTMHPTSNKHVCVAEYDSKGTTIYCIGGNQKDKICTLNYERKYVYALYRPEY